MDAIFWPHVGETLTRWKGQPKWRSQEAGPVRFDRLGARAPLRNAHRGGRAYLNKMRITERSKGWKVER
jgi:hypothetical protein